LLVISVFAGGFYLFQGKNYQELKSNLTKYASDLLNLNDVDYTRINIKGNKYTKYEDIADIVRNAINKAEDINVNDGYILIVKRVKEEIEKLPWVEKVTVTRNLPNTLNISITEYEPFAIWQNKNNRYVINKDGKIIEIDDKRQFDNLLILTGKNANFHAKSLFNILTIDSAISRNIHYAAWVGDRRWNITFFGGVLVKLPANNVSDAWSRLIKIYNMPGSLIGLKVIDLRNSEKIYLEYSINE